MEWKAKPWDALTRDEWHAMVRLRVDVFVVEQDCPYPDLDGKVCVLGMCGAKRSLWPREQLLWHVPESWPRGEYAEPSIGRVATRRDQRGKGIGKELMRRSIEVAEQTWPGQDIRISAQCYLEGWYGELGFVALGSPYLEDDIPHIQMVKSSVA